MEATDKVNKQSLKSKIDGQYPFSKNICLSTIIVRKKVNQENSV